MADTPARHGTPWTEDDYLKLLDILDSGLTLGAVCKRMERTTASIEPKASKFGYEFEDGTGKAVKRPGGPWNQAYKGTYDKWLERQRKPELAEEQPPEKQQLFIEKSRKVGMTTLAEWAAKISARTSAVSTDYSALEARVVANLQRPLRWDELASLDWIQQESRLPRRYPSDLLNQTDKGLKQQVLYVSPEMLDSILTLRSQKPRFVAFDPIKDELSEAQAYAYKALTESLKPIQERQIGFLQKYFAKGGTVERTFNPGSEPQPKETTMNCNINPESFKVKIQTTYVFNGANLNYATDAMVYTYIKQVEDQIKELKNIETASQKKAAEIEGLQAVAAKLSTFLDNRQELQNSAYSERDTVYADKAETDKQVKDLEAKALTLQLELSMVRKERDNLIARVASYEKMMNSGASSIKFSDPQV